MTLTSSLTTTWYGPGAKSILDFHWPMFDTIRVPYEAKRWGKILAKQVEFRGICDECLKRGKKVTDLSSVYINVDGLFFSIMVGIIPK